jgi:hypothetical protein
MRGAVPPLPQFVFMAWYSVKHRGSFTFYRIHFTSLPCVLHYQRISCQTLNFMEIHCVVSYIQTDAHVVTIFGRRTGPSCHTALFHRTHSQTRDNYVKVTHASLVVITASVPKLSPRSGTPRAAKSRELIVVTLDSARGPQNNESMQPVWLTSA